MAAPPRVLVVDDEPSVRRIATRVLERESIETVVACDGDEALELLGAQHFDLVLLDSTMPRMGGREVLERMAARGLSARALLSSGYSDMGMPRIEDFPNLVGFLPKPYTLSQLVQRVREALDSES